jgi:2-aminoadipate transaminase
MNSSEKINFTRGVPAGEALVSISSDLTEAARIALQDGESAQKILQYGPAAGLLSFRNWLAETYKTLPANVMVGNSSVELFEFITKLLTQPGDTVFVESPSYDRALTVLKSSGLKVVEIELRDGSLDMETLESQLKKKVPKFFYVIPDFQNPSGSCMTLNARKRLVELAEKYGFVIVEDGPYRELRYTGQAEASIYSLAPHKCIHLSSFSKIIGPGVRVGYLLGNEDIVAKLSTAAEQHYITPNYFAQGVVEAWCRQGLLGPQIARLKQLYAPRLQACLDAFDEYLPGSLLSRPQGGFFASAKLDTKMSSEVLQRKAALVGLLLTNGSTFFAEQPKFCFVRIPFCGLNPGEIREGVHRLKEVISS